MKVRYTTVTLLLLLITCFGLQAQSVGKSEYQIKRVQSNQPLKASVGSSQAAKQSSQNESQQALPEGMTKESYNSRVLALEKIINDSSYPADKRENARIHLTKLVQSQK